MSEACSAAGRAKLVSTADITILLHPDEITLMHTLYPLLRSRQRRRFRFSTDVAEALRRPRTRALCLVRFSKLDRAGMRQAELLEMLRERYERLIYIDNNASAGAVKERALRTCDLYYKRSLYADRSLYCEPVRSGRLFVDHYFRGESARRVRAADGAGGGTGSAAAGTAVSGSNPSRSVRRLAADAPLDRLRLLWNIGIGSYPRSGTRKALVLRLGAGGARIARRLRRPELESAAIAGVRRLYRNAPSAGRKVAGMPVASRQPVVSARFGTSFDVPGIGGHRALFEGAASRDERFRTGFTDLRTYNRELRTAAGVLSPFGYGEECLRDFEAVVHGAVLIKPSMDHVETWPDIYRPWRTYFPCRWDASDLSEVTDRLFGDPAAARSVAGEAEAVLAEAWECLEERVERFVAEVLD